MDIYIIKTNRSEIPQQSNNAFLGAGVIEISVADIEINSLAIDYDFMKRRYHIKISNEEILVFLSHRQAWLKFLESGADFCLIIEDNVELLGDIAEIENSVQSLSENWDASFPFDKFEDETITKGQPYFLDFYWGSCAYFLSRTGAQKLMLINSIRQPLDDEILSLNYSDDFEIYYGNESRFKIEFDKALVHVGRCREINETLLSYNAWTDHHKGLIRKILTILSAIASDIGISLILHGGSLLGYVRHGQILPWDDDVDLGIEEGDFEKFTEAVKKDNRLMFMQRKEGHTNTFYYKFWLDEGEIINPYPYKFPFVDLWLYKRNVHDIVFHNGITFPNAFNYAFEKIYFEGCLYDIPGNYLECLDNWYKGWRAQIKVYPYCHRLERLENIPFQTGIFTDEKGRFISYRTH